MKGLVLFAHGSPIESANAPIRRLAEQARERLGFDLAQAAFLDSTTPDLAAALEDLVRRGATQAVIVPFFLTLGTHMQRDLPRIVDELRGIYPGVGIEVTPPLEGHPGLLDIVLDRAAGILNESKAD
jgi:sirohydrochlorin ferrochelatase